MDLDEDLDHLGDSIGDWVLEEHKSRHWTVHADIAPGTSSALLGALTTRLLRALGDERAVHVSSTMLRIDGLAEKEIEPVLGVLRRFKSVERIAASASEVTTHLPVNVRTVSALIIEDEDKARRVTERMLTLGIPVRSRINSR